jgi:hypothetical protein
MLKIKPCYLYQIWESLLYPHYHIFKQLKVILNALSSARHLISPLHVLATQKNYYQNSVLLVCHVQAHSNILI